jgi:hypothetical protein
MCILRQALELHLIVKTFLLHFITAAQLYENLIDCSGFEM